MKGHKCKRSFIVGIAEVRNWKKAFIAFGFTETKISAVHDVIGPLLLFVLTLMKSFPLCLLFLISPDVSSKLAVSAEIISFSDLWHLVRFLLFFMIELYNMTRSSFYVNGDL